MEKVVDIKRVTKKFGDFKALDEVDFSVRKGEVFGFIGPNGAGKSTTIRILLGILKATEGQATIFGKDVWNDSMEIHRQVAYVPGDVNLWPNLTGGEVIDLFAKLRGGRQTKRREELLERYKLDPTKNVARIQRETVKKSHSFPLYYQKPICIFSMNRRRDWTR